MVKVVKLAPYVPISKMKRDRRGRLIGGLREKQLVAEAKAMWRAAHLIESMSGARQIKARVVAELKEATAAMARKVALEEIKTSRLRERVALLRGRARRSDWQRPGIEAEVLEAMSETRPVYPTLTLTEEVSAAAVGREAVAGSSVGQLMRPRRAAEKPMKGVAPRTPFDQMHDDQTDAAIRAAEAEGDNERANRLMALAARQRHIATGNALNTFAAEAENPMNLVGDDQGNVGGRAHYTYKSPDDEIKMDSGSKRQQAIMDMLDEAEMYMAEHHEDPEEIKDLISRIGEMLKGEPDQDVRKALSTAAASLSRLIGETYETDDHGSHAEPTFAAEDEAEVFYTTDGDIWSGPEDGDKFDADGNPVYPVEEEDEDEMVARAMRGHETGGGASGGGSVPAVLGGKGQRVPTQVKPAGTKDAVGSVYRKMEAAREILESLRPFSHEYSMLHRVEEE